MIYSILVYISILLGAANGDCGYSSTLIQFDEKECDSVEIVYQKYLFLDDRQSGDHLTSLIDSATTQVQGEGFPPHYDFGPNTGTGPSPGLWKYFTPADTFDPSIIRSRCHALKLTSVLGTSGDADFASSTLAPRSLAQFHAHSSDPSLKVVVLLDGTLISHISQQESLVTSLTPQGSYKFSIYILLFDDLLPGVENPLWFAWLSQHTDDAGVKSFSWMMSEDQTTTPANTLWFLVGNDASKKPRPDMLSTTMVCPDGKHHFVMATKDHRSFNVRAFPQVGGEALGLYSGQVHFRIKILNQVQLGKLTLEASCVGGGSVNGGFGDRKRTVDGFGRFVVDPCGAPNLIGRYANPSDDSLAHVKCYSATENECITPIAMTSSFGYCWGTVTFAKAREICGRIGSTNVQSGTWDIPTYEEIVNENPSCCQKFSSSMSVLGPQFTRLTCHSGSHLYWTQSSRASLNDPVVYAAGTAESPTYTSTSVGTTQPWASNLEFTKSEIPDHDSPSYYYDYNGVNLDDHDGYLPDFGYSIYAMDHYYNGEPVGRLSWNDPLAYMSAGKMVGLQDFEIVSEDDGSQSILLDHQNGLKLDTWRFGSGSSWATQAVPLTLNYESVVACDMLEVRFTFKAPVGETLSFTRAWRVNTYQGFQVTVKPFPKKTVQMADGHILDNWRRQLLTGRMSLQDRFCGSMAWGIDFECLWGQGQGFDLPKEIGFASNSVLDFQGGVGTPPDFKFMSENGRSFCSETGKGKRICMTNYQAQFEGYLKTSVTESCQISCRHIGDCVVHIDDDLVYEAYRDDAVAQSSTKDMAASKEFAFEKDAFYKFRLGYQHFHNDEHFVQLLWDCPSMAAVHSGVLVTGPTGDPHMSRSTTERLVPHEAFWSRSDTVGLSADVSATDCDSETVVIFKLSSRPTHPVDVVLTSDTVGIHRCNIRFEPDGTSWRGMQVRVSNGPGLNAIHASSRSADTRFHLKDIDVTIIDCPSHGRGATVRDKCILSADAIFWPTSDQDLYSGSIPRTGDVDLYVQSSPNGQQPPVKVSARVVNCSGMAKCVIGGAVKYGRQVYGVYQEAGNTVLTVNSINNGFEKKRHYVGLRVTEELYCTTFSAVTGFKVTFCINDMKYVDIVVDIPAHSRDTLSGECFGDSSVPPSSLFHYPEGFAPEGNPYLWCDGQDNTKDEAAMTIKKKNRSPASPIPATFQSGTFSSVGADCSFTGLLSTLISGDEFYPFLAGLSSTCAQSAKHFPTRVMTQSRKIIAYYTAEYLVLTGQKTPELDFALVNSLEKNKFFCGAHAAPGMMGCRCDDRSGEEYPNCTGETYASQALILNPLDRCGNDVSVLSDPTTGEIWKCFRGQCQSSKDGVRFKAFDDGVHLPFCFTGISWSDADRTQGRSLWAFSDTGVEIRSLDGGKTWQPMTYEDATKTTTDPSYSAGATFEGKGGNIWAVTDTNLCVTSSTLSHAKKTITYCSNWWCDCE